MATMGTMNAAIAQSSEVIQQLMNNRHRVRIYVRGKQTMQTY